MATGGGRKEQPRASALFPPQDSIGLLLRIALRGLRGAFKARLARSGIALGGWYCLRVLWEGDGLTQRELTDRVGLMQPNAAAALKALERDGLVRIERSQSDRRKSLVYLTDRAERMKPELLADMHRVVDEIALAGFSPGEADELRRLLHRVCTNVERHRAAGPRIGADPAGSDGENSLPATSEAKKEGT